MRSLARLPQAGRTQADELLHGICATFGAHVDVEMGPVLDALGLWDRLEEEPGEGAVGVPATVGVVEHAGERSVLTSGADDLDAFVGHLVTLGRPSRVVEPPELAAHVAAVVERLRVAVGPALWET